MTKKERKEIERKINNNTATLFDQKVIQKDIIISSGIRFILSLALSLYSLLFYDKMSKLALITADTVLNHIVFIKPDLLYFISLFLLLSISGITFVTFISFMKNIYKNYTKAHMIFYKLYDIGSFILSIIVIINTIILFIITPVTVEGNSMNNTLYPGDKALIYHFWYNPSNEDIVIIDGKDYVNNEIFIVKRIVAKEGDKLYKTLVGENKYHIYHNDKPLLKNVSLEVWNHLTNNSKDHQFTIPENYYLVLGDNRVEGQSLDSREFGLVKEKDILGKLVFRYYPFNSMGTPDKNIKE